MEANPKSLSILNHMAHDTVASGGPIIFHYWGHSKLPLKKLHKHSYFECCYVTDGSGVFTNNNTEYDLAPGSFFLSKPGVLHRIHGTPSVRFYFVGFEAGETEPGGTNPLTGVIDRLMDPSRVCFPLDEKSLTATLWDMLLTEAEFFSNHFKETLLGITHALIASFADQFCGPEPDRLSVNDRGSQYAYLHQAKLLVRDNLSRKIKFTELADYLHISERRLSRLFQMEGQTFSDFCRKERIKKVCHLLKATPLSLEEIAEETGFYSLHHMSNVFKLQIGISPGRYRREQL